MTLPFKHVFLVTLCGGMDDFPIGLHPTEEDARKFVEENPITEVPEPRPHRGWVAGTEDGPVMKAYRVAGIDMGHVLGYKIWKFEDGVLTRVDIAAWID